MNHHHQQKQESSTNVAGGVHAKSLLLLLRARFRLLADLTSGAITTKSLRRSAASVLGLGGGAVGGEITVEETTAMVQEGDQDSDNALSKVEFYVLMVRLSPGIMGDTEGWHDEAIANKLLHSTLPV
jgi:hypothetical protein|nr:calcium-binding protein KRP1-like [Oryza sativa Japonica Group]